MLSTVTDKFNQYLIKRRFKKRRQRSRGMKAKISSPQRFFSDLEESGIPYVVLRWHSEVPASKAEINRFIADENDIDILIEQGHDSKLIAILARNRGDLDVDIYSDTGRKGFSYNDYPYYPVGMAKKILESREKKGSFCIPSPEMHAYSLLYHLVYHKGVESGIPTGIGNIKTKNKPDRHNTFQVINQILRKSDISSGISSENYNLSTLYNILSEKEWLMPTDQLRRWKKKDAFHHYLLSREEEAHVDLASKLPETMVFLLREDANSTHDRNLCREELKKHFEIVKEHSLTSDQVDRLCRLTRGGNWYEVSGTTLVKPAYIFICYDHSPQAIPSDSALAKLHPHVSNNKTFIKYDIRDSLKKRNTAKTVGLHSSDNALEAFEMIHATYTSESDNICNQLVTAANHSN